MPQSFITYSVPADVDERVQKFRVRIAAKRGVPVSKVSVSGDTLRALLAVVEAADQLGAPGSTQSDVPAAAK